MFNFFKLDIIPTFLSKFKVEKVLLIGLSNENIINEVISFCIENYSILFAIDSKTNIEDLIRNNFNMSGINEYIDKNVKYFKDEGLNILPTLKTFDAIFINDDSNWYTVYNELNLIKKNNESFPLVFVCNNKYPHKRRDSYINPENIPKEYRNECCDTLPIEYELDNEIESTMVKDGLCHAISENTEKNGVLTAIEDFLKENNNLKFLEINPLEGISLIYNDTSISYIRIDQILEEQVESTYTLGDLSDKFIENNLLLNHIAELNLLKEDIDNINEFKFKINEKNNQIKEYEDEIKLTDNKLNYKNSQINNIKSQLNLKETQLKKMEVKLFNKDNEIKSAQNKISDANIESKNQKIFENKYRDLIEINKKEIEAKDNEIEAKDNEIEAKNYEIEAKNYEIEAKNYEIEAKNNDIEAKNIELGAYKQKYFNKLDRTEYNLMCYKEQMRNMDVEIEYLKNNDNIRKKLFIPISYVYLITKSNFREIGTNIKLYNILKNNEYFDIGYYLNKYPDLKKSKWCKFFSPELHYVCRGFDENRKINKKDYKHGSKKELINCIK